MTFADSDVFNQLKQNQAEKNVRLDALLSARQETNRLLAQMLANRP
jgi:hypothetical protein